eukprot:CAMPEP_0203804354 /NCGR_PEP_ID=MMETSP0100_2-20121128/13514_1 /ASSEMBLY_ACC=CAM_ASM_000210 /TAXON_ID=96639 /ORGANISM=" , Strain NY0313808BC1" /LENGTH=63 /DNA_ID=CAMNT_0050712515 /DNA_START=23 /DNA_END=214 /DNA_ORIENTATION=+
MSFLKKMVEPRSLAAWATAGGLYFAWSKYDEAQKLNQVTFSKDEQAEWNERIKQKSANKQQEN